jgi:hypothetical protein
MVAPRRIEVRKPSLRFDDVPRHWLLGRAFPTHLANSLHLLFPMGERFFVRSVRAYADRIADPQLAEQVRAFMGQEVRHGLEHERAFEQLEAQGYEIRSFLGWYERVAYDLIDPNTSPALRLSVTVALEHFTAMFASQALSSDLLTQNAHPAMRDLLLWHACEELEHKAVAFDVLKQVAPSYALRAAGLGVGAGLLLFFWMAGARHLLAQEPQAGLRERLAQLLAGRRHNALLNGGFARAFLGYLRPGFHPDDTDDAALAEDWLARHGYALGLAGWAAGGPERAGSRNQE